MFIGQVKAMRSEMDSLSGDLKKYAEQIEQLPDFDGELEKVRQDSSCKFLKVFLESHHHPINIISRIARIDF